MKASQELFELVQHQLNQFGDCPNIRNLVVYLAISGNTKKTSLVVLGSWPPQHNSLPTLEDDPSLQILEPCRLWLPLRRQHLFLGVLRAEIATLPWSTSLTTRLQSCAYSLTEALFLELERQQLQEELSKVHQQAQLLVHQLRNPLTALRTFSQLLLKRLEPGNGNRALVKGMLVEQQQLNRYVEAIDRLGRTNLVISSSPAIETPLLLPPALMPHNATGLKNVLAPLIERAKATATLQKRYWQGPETIPVWYGNENAVLEILANLLENAFRYCPPKQPIGLYIEKKENLDEWMFCVWDGGPSIPISERESIFQKGKRGSSSINHDGTGFGLALAQDLAHQLGGRLELSCPPAEIHKSLPTEGNAFCLFLPCN
ncbi:two-component sensor histidine kinase (chromatophore) [Paulinella micropora]|uniref:histidine kinase n=1 Tax=Paulinella micropora TaxID=1928728 RepID=A0A1S6YI96_9EUKA|nr:two-component sensor histidine kinase [Paulinella micropora]BBL86263.1 two-component sensor histidine kinase [Paulinella micropora]